MPPYTYIFNRTINCNLLLCSKTNQASV